MKNLLVLFLFGSLAIIISSCERSQDTLDLAEQATEDWNEGGHFYGVNVSTGKGQVFTLNGDQLKSDYSGVQLRSPVSANGHYNVESPYVPGTSSITYTFSAGENNGGVHGHVNVHGLQEGISDFDMDVECILVEGNRATIGGVITNVTVDPGFTCFGCCGADYQFFAVGNNVLFAVEDNGEGAGAAPDKAAGVLWIGFPTCPLDCSELPPYSEAWEVYGPWPDVFLSSDQIQVKP